MRQCKDWIDDYLAYTDNTEPRESYRAWAAVSTIAAALKRRCWVSIGHLTWYPNFFVVLVGPPAARKGTAIDPAVQLMNSVGLVSVPEEPTRQALIDMMVHSEQSFTEGGSIHQYSAVTIVAPELTVFLKRGDEAMFSTLCDWYDCRSRFIYSTRQRGNEYIVNVWVNMLAATTPEVLQLSLPTEAFGGGLASRAIFVYEEQKKLPIVVWPTLDKTLEPKLKHDLEEILTLQGQFRFEDGDAFIDEYTKFRIMTEEHPPVTDPKLCKYNERRAMHIMKLALVMSAARSNDKIITVADFRKALAMLSRAEKKMHLAFTGIGMNPLARIQAQIMALLRLKKRMHRKEIINIFHEDITMNQLAEILSTLLYIGFCEKDPADDSVIRLKE